MKEELLTLDRMVMIGAAGRNCGKTSLALALIKAWRGRFPMIALKVTTIHDAGGSCVRGHAGCGTCTRIKGSFDLVEETEESELMSVEERHATLASIFGDAAGLVHGRMSGPEKDAANKKIGHPQPVAVAPLPGDCNC